MTEKSTQRAVLLAPWLFLGGISAVAAAPIMEVRSVTVYNTFDDRSFSSVDFQQSYNSAPLVFALPTNQGSDPSTLRLRNVSGDGFEVVQAESAGEDGPHVAMNTSYLAIVPGVYDFGGGLVVEAGYIETTTTVQKYSPEGGFESIAFNGSFSDAPALLVDIQTMNNESADRPPPAGPSSPWITAKAQNISQSGAQISLERSEVDDGGTLGLAERIGYVAFSQGIFSSDTLLGGLVSIESLITGRTVTGWDDTSGAGNNVGLSGNFNTAPLVFANMASRYGNNGGWLRRGAVTGSSVNLLVDEDRYRDSERHHTGEQASIVAFSGDFAYSTPDLSGPSGFGPAGVPEPGVPLLLGVGLAALGFQRRGRKAA